MNRVWKAIKDILLSQLPAMTWSVSMNNWSAFGCCFYTTVSYLSVTRTSAQQSPLTFTHKCILSLSHLSLCVSFCLCLSFHCSSHLFVQVHDTSPILVFWSNNIFLLLLLVWGCDIWNLSHVRLWLEQTVLLHWPTYIKQQWLIMKVKRRGQNLQVTYFECALILTLLKCCAFVIFCFSFISVRNFSTSTFLSVSFQGNISNFSSFQLILFYFRFFKLTKIYIYFDNFNFS